MNIKVIVLSRSIAIVIDTWDFPFNGGVVSTRRFVQALEDQYSFKLLATPDTDQKTDRRMVPFERISLPGFNAIFSEMKVPLARSDRNRLHLCLQDYALQNLARWLDGLPDRSLLLMDPFRFYFCYFFASVAQLTQNSFIVLA